MTTPPSASPRTGLSVSCFFAPNPDTPRHIELAEQLGFDMAWCFDTPALCGDVWMTLGRAADRTSRINLATGMMIPALRHVMATASAIASLEQAAPGRVRLGVATGLTGMAMLRLPQMTWSAVSAHIEAIRALLRGEEIEWNGAILRLSYPNTYAGRYDFPIEVPWYVAAEGPKGLETAKRLGVAGVVNNGAVPAGFGEVIRVLTGTVVSDGEEIASERLIERAGAGAALAYHMGYNFAGAAAVDGLPGGRQWREALEAIPTERRHLAHWDGHLVEFNELDRAHIPAEAIKAISFVGDKAAMRDFAAKWAEEGVTGVGFTPAGDIEDELRKMARALDL